MRVVVRYGNGPKVMWNESRSTHVPEGRIEGGRFVSQTRKAVEEVYGRYNPRVLWRVATVPLLDYGWKENTRLIVRGPASPGNTIRSLTDRLYDYIVISWQWSWFLSTGLSSGNFLTSWYNDHASRFPYRSLSLSSPHLASGFFGYRFFFDQFRSVISIEWLLCLAYSILFVCVCF